MQSVPLFFTCKCLLSTTEKYVKHKMKPLCKIYCDLKKINRALEVFHVQRRSFVITNKVEEIFTFNETRTAAISSLTCLLNLPITISFVPLTAKCLGISVRILFRLRVRPQLDHQLIRVFSDRTSKIILGVINSMSLRDRVIGRFYTRGRTIRPDR